MPQESHITKTLFNNCLCLGAFFGYSQITTLTSKLHSTFITLRFDKLNRFCAVISWDRYNVIVKGFNAGPMTYTKVTLLIIFNWIWSFGWAVSPLVGWGLYALDGMLGT